MSRLPQIAAATFLWAVLGTLAVDAVLYCLGGYEATITRVVRGWASDSPAFRLAGILFFVWLTCHLFLHPAQPR